MNATQDAWRTPLKGMKIVTLAVNLPGPLACARLAAAGAEVVKVEPPGGDPLARVSSEYYRSLSAGQEVVILDLKTPDGRTTLHDLLADADLLLTASRPSALTRLGLSWAALHARFPALCQVSIVGYSPPDEDLPGHDLTYQATAGLIVPPQMPRVLTADLAGGEIAAREAVSLLLARARGFGAGYSQVALSRVVGDFAEPFRLGLTAPGGVLGGGSPRYRIYLAKEGYVALA
ncbi:CoA transferase [Rubrobacter xylanophilus]|uniref:CoA transferase n=1 Tax=Rubrobacter xylanophilus TaxID=49319 RepID=A0A510HGZ9_9ACTN|nr:CoA transferase [Rubrobacter xylanophilus]BBL79276.1 CoA transferase [Rubrobacter xylanophilus]